MGYHRHTNRIQPYGHHQLLVLLGGGGWAGNLLQKTRCTRPGTIEANNSRFILTEKLLHLEHLAHGWQSTPWRTITVADTAVNLLAHPGKIPSSAGSREISAIEDYSLNLQNFYLLHHLQPCPVQNSPGLEEFPIHMSLSTKKWPIITTQLEWNIHKTYKFHSHFTCCMLLATWGWWYAEPTIPWATKSLVEKLGIKTFCEFHTSQHTGVFVRRKIVHSSTSLHVDWVSIAQGMDSHWYQLWVMWHHMSHWGRDVTVGEVQLWSKISWKPKNNYSNGKRSNLEILKNISIFSILKFPGHEQKNTIVYSSKKFSHMQK